MPFLLQLGCEKGRVLRRRWPPLKLHARIEDGVCVTCSSSCFIVALHWMDGKVQDTL